MIKVNFYDSVDDAKLKYAVIISKTNGKWVFCKHKQRDTYEVPGGHREEGEDILTTAKRELNEETGAVDFDIKPICVYSVDRGDTETFGMLYFADIRSFEEIHSEIEKIIITDSLPENWTYPLIQPFLLEHAEKLGFI
ncbi:MAG: NUDIX domain-containing protein [Ruminococcus sp.]|nr:NUDIX domain-containing protein [Ruminococcus sp.]